MGHKFERYCKDYKNIENYDKAKADNFKGWHCHHRLETHTSDGERRLVDITVAELKALDMYYNRPSSELIFLTESEHNAFNKGKHRSIESRRKMSEAHKGKQAGEKHPMYGKHHSEESKNKNSEAHKGKHPSEETRKKLSEANKGNKSALGHSVSDEARNKIGASSKGTRWYNNGKINIRAKECPDGFVPGRLLIK